MNEFTNEWLWLVVGFVPFKVSFARGWWQALRVEVRAIFWSLQVVRTPYGQWAWSLDVPLIARMKQAVEAFVTAWINRK